VTIAEIIQLVASYSFRQATAAILDNLDIFIYSFYYHLSSLLAEMQYSLSTYQIIIVMHFVEPITASTLTYGFIIL